MFITTYNMKRIPILTTVLTLFGSSLAQLVPPLFKALPVPKDYSTHCKWCTDWSLLSPQALVSNNNPNYLLGANHRLSMQSDGNLVLYNGLISHNAVWSNKQWTPRPASSYRLQIQSDGNLVQYDSNGQWKWDTKTGGRPNGKYCLKVEDDGNLRIFDSNCNAIWSRY